LLVAIAQVDPTNDEQPILEAKFVERRKIAGARLLPYREIQWGRAGRRLLGGRVPVLGDNSQAAPDLIGDAILDRTSQITLERPMASRFEAVDPPERLKKDVLNDVGSISRRPDPRGQSTMGPPHERRKLPREKDLER